MQRIHYFGIRHHGPGCSARLVSALDKLQPKKILIEGPTDCSELLPLLAHHETRPPVALLAYATETPECHFYYPFAQFSPEYQACLWAVNHGVPVAFIDVPVNIKLAKALLAFEQQDDIDELMQESTQQTDEQITAKTDELSALSFDPIGVLAKLAGYQDGESWWNDLLEQSHGDGDDQAVFVAIGNAMTVLRQKLIESHSEQEEDLVREAYMRLQIAEHTKEDTTVAVVCGAWHTPALDPACQLYHADGKPIKFTTKADTALVKKLPKKLPASKVKSTWIPWTSVRLASRYYGAGVNAPMWYLHLWQSRFAKNAPEQWLTKVANALREKGNIVSTASVIEAVRLSNSLARLRGRNVGFEELGESAVACLCFGEPLLWEQISDELLLGQEVGQIPSDMPLAPLLEDLQRLQKQTKLKPEALQKEILLDLRSQIGLNKSWLLHRLNILGVAWGQELDATSSQGTFREKWLLAWEPEFSVALVENLVYGNTIYGASSRKLTEQIGKQSDLSQLVLYIQQALKSGLNDAVAVGLERLSEQATHTDNTLVLIKSIAPLVHLQRYGTARQMALDKVGELVYELVIKASVSLPYTIKNINDEESLAYHEHINKAHHALKLCNDETLMQAWWQAFVSIADNDGDEYSPMVRGLIIRLLYQAKHLDGDLLATILQKTLSPAVKSHWAARFFEGFFDGAVLDLLYDKLLLSALQNWVMALDETDFVEHLPLFRRVFSTLDSSERKRLLDVIFGAGGSEMIYKHNSSLALAWQNHLAHLSTLLTVVHKDES